MRLLRSVNSFAPTKTTSRNDVVAFTLAEVLITLGIIGVVAAMTIPTILNKANEVETRSGVKTAYSTISQAVAMVKNQNGSDFLGIWQNNFDNVAFKNVMAHYLKVAKDCGGTEGTDSSNAPRENGCFFTRTAYDKTDNDEFNGYAGVILQNGMDVVFRAHEPACTVSGVASMCGWVMVDINGSKKPNVIGKDSFPFYINSNGTVGVGGDPGVQIFSAWWKTCTGLETGIKSGWGCTYKYLSN